jgi:hypothetical protein
MKFLIITKNNGKIYEKLMFEDTSRPINQVELAYVPITDEMEDTLTTHDRVIDYENTVFTNGAWQAVFIEPVKYNILANRQRDKAAFIKEANKKLLIPDASDTFKTLVNVYIAELNAIVPTNEEIQAITWPTKPW